MRRKIVWLVVSGMMVLSLLAASCAPAIEEAVPTTPTTPTTPATPTTPTAPTTPTTPTGPEMVKVTLTKRDGTKIEKMVEKPRYGGELILVRERPIAGWDDVVASASLMQWSLDNVVEKLLEGDWAMGLSGTEETTFGLGSLFDIRQNKGALAESWEIVQPDTIIFHIRQGVHFSLNPALEASRLVTGREVTADDVVFNIKRSFFEIKTSSAYTGSESCKARPLDVYAPDKWTVVVKSPPERIWICFEYLVGDMNIYAPEVVTKYGNCQDWDRCIGTDAFMLTDYVSMSQATYSRNPNYWGKDPIFPENQVPYVDRVKLLIVPDASTRMSALRTGKVDVDNTFLLFWEDMGSLKKTNPELKYEETISALPYMGGRQDKPELPFKDIRVRRALMMAINHQQIVDTYYGGAAAVLSYAVPANIKDWEECYTPLEEIGLAPDGFDTQKCYTYHPEDAKKLLAEAGYPNGFKTEVVTIPRYVDWITMVKSYWAENLNVDLAIDVKEQAVYTNIGASKSYKGMYASSWLNLGNAGIAPYFSLDRTTGSALPPTDSELEKTNEQLMALEPWSDEWIKLLKEANVYAIHKMNYVLSPQAATYFVWQPWVKSYNCEWSVGKRLFQMWNRYVWIDQEIKKAMGH